MFIAKFSSKTIRQEEPIKAQNTLFHFVHECTSLRRMVIIPLSLVDFFWFEINPTCDADLIEITRQQNGDIFFYKSAY